MKQTAEQRDLIGTMPVKYIHLRNKIDVELGKSILNNMGGATIAYVEKDGFVTHYAVAYCSKKDNFSRKVGRDKSRGRLNSFFLATVFLEKVTSKEFFTSINEEWEGRVDHGLLQRN